MHPLRLSPACSTCTGPWLLLSVLIVFGGCGFQQSADPLLAPVDTLFSETGDGRSAALETLQAIEYDSIQTAFARLDEHAFTRYVRTDQFAPSGRRTAFRERVERYENAASRTVLHRDSSGTFQFDTFDRFAPTATDSLPANLTEYVIQDDASYVEPRTQEAYRYRTYADTLAPATPVEVIEVRAQPDERGRDVSIRHVRLYLDPDSRQLVGLYLVRAEQAALFREDSRFFVSLRPAPESRGWVPHVTRFRARVSIPLRSPQAFRSVSAYYDYAALR